MTAFHYGGSHLSYNGNQSHSSHMYIGLLFVAQPFQETNKKHSEDHSISSETFHTQLIPFTRYRASGHHFRAFITFTSERPTSLPPLRSTMCIKIVERYAVCKCVYYQHAVDPCRLYGQHPVNERTVLVGYSCPTHTTRQTSMAPIRPTGNASHDSGYHSGGSAKKPKTRK